MAIAHNSRTNSQNGNLNFPDSAMSAVSRPHRIQHNPPPVVAKRARILAIPQISFFSVPAI